MFKRENSNYVCSRVQKLIDKHASHVDMSVEIKESCANTLIVGASCSADLVPDIQVVFAMSMDGSGVSVDVKVSPKRFTAVMQLGDDDLLELGATRDELSDPDVCIKLAFKHIEPLIIKWVQGRIQLVPIRLGRLRIGYSVLVDGAVFGRVFVLAAVGRV